jgi:hypothetical protein
VPGISPWVEPQRLRCSRLDACFVAACLHQHGPGDPRQLIGKGSSQHVVMQAVCRGCQPRAKTVLCPVCWPEQNNTGTLHEERAQIAIATFGDAAKDGAVPVDICFGTRPSHAAKSRPLAKAASEGNAGDPDDGRRVQSLDARAAISFGRRVEDRRCRKGRKTRRRLNQVLHIHGTSGQAEASAIPNP